ncbi:SUMF1/EgtB/PvdO family nonheme iron enzyme [candidate division WOR-3 bacterium]|nr:SUMF1/EgtB/PvdO family nonheme iron enzyme [candidate division WOR-3 bacterium]
MKTAVKYLAFLWIVAFLACDAIDQGDLTGKGVLSIITRPTGCEVFINGSRQNEKTNCILDSISKQKEVVVRLVKGNYVDWTDTVNMTNIDTFYIDETFTGDLEVKSTPEGAEIFLADTGTGHTTPHKFTEFIAGPYKVKLKKDEYLDYEQQVTVYTDQTATVDAVLVTDVTGIEWILIPSGWFTMGSSEEDSESWPEERPQHDVYLDAYYISKCEITNEQFCEFLNDYGNTYQGHTCIDLDPDECQIYYSDADEKYYVETGMNDNPVIYVSWYGARGFCQWAGGRLPTEAEWEKAARGTDARKYPWGDTPPSSSLANYGGEIGASKSVGSYPDGASAYGCLDMAGNVLEWVADWYSPSYYEISPDSNPQGPESGTCPVKRGGSWYFAATTLRCAFRHHDYDYPFDGWDDVGFRPARD